MSRTILIVDDSPTMIKSIKDHLEGAGFTVLTADDGDTALEALRAGAKPHLIITDINMARMGGLELIREVKALPGMRFTPILTLTTESDGALRSEAKQLGATGWLVKPVLGADLVNVVRQVLPGA